MLLSLVLLLIILQGSPDACQTDHTLAAGGALGLIADRHQTWGRLGLPAIPVIGMPTHLQLALAC